MQILHVYQEYYFSFYLNLQEVGAIPPPTGLECGTKNEKEGRKKKVLIKGHYLVCGTTACTPYHLAPFGKSEVNNVTLKSEISENIK